MAIIHQTTMSPGKLDLLAGWLPAQPWYLGKARGPALARAGGFRLDDPQGEVGVEFMVVTDGSGDEAISYQVPMTYRGAELPGAGACLIGTSEHGVLGRRWIYDGPGDPVFVAQLVALIQGEAEPQAQSLSNTPDRAVTGMPVTDASLTVTGPAAIASGQSGTDLRIAVAVAGGAPGGSLTVRVHRVLRPAASDAVAGEAGQPCLSAIWRLPDGTLASGIFATAQYTPHP